MPHVSPTGHMRSVQNLLVSPPSTSYSLPPRVSRQYRPQSSAEPLQEHSFSNGHSNGLSNGIQNPAPQSSRVEKQVHSLQNGTVTREQCVLLTLTSTAS